MVVGCFGLYIVILFSIWLVFGLVWFSCFLDSQLQLRLLLLLLMLCCLILPQCQCVLTKLSFTSIAGCQLETWSALGGGQPAYKYLVLSHVWHIVCVGQLAKCPALAMWIWQKVPHLQQASSESVVSVKKPMVTVKALKVLVVKKKSQLLRKPAYAFSVQEYAAGKTGFWSSQEPKPKRSSILYLGKDSFNFPLHCKSLWATSSCTYISICFKNAYGFTYIIRLVDKKWIKCNVNTYMYDGGPFAYSFHNIKFILHHNCVWHCNNCTNCTTNLYYKHIHQTNVYTTTHVLAHPSPMDVIRPFLATLYSM